MTSKPSHQIAVIIPALDEQDTIQEVISGIDRQLVHRVIVIDNGSLDATADRALEAGAEVFLETRKGYGSACLRGIRAAPEADILVFMDADGSDNPHEIGMLLDTLEINQADLVIGSRVLGSAQKGSLSPLQIFGNALTCNLVDWFWGVKYTDLGPFRAIRSSVLKKLNMNDPDFGWTIEMQVKAAQQKLQVIEIPVGYQIRRGGKSKISGTIKGSFRAGKTILSYVLRAKLSEILE